MGDSLHRHPNPIMVLWPLPQTLLAHRYTRVHHPRGDSNHDLNLEHRSAVL